MSPLSFSIFGGTPRDIREWTQPGFSLEQKNRTKSLHEGAVRSLHEDCLHSILCFRAHIRQVKFLLSMMCTSQAYTCQWAGWPTQGHTAPSPSTTGKSPFLPNT